MPYIFCPDISRTTIEGAVEFLSGKMPCFEQYGPATIETLPTRFPEFSVRTLVALWGPRDADGNGVGVGMASAKFFTARRAIKIERERYPIEALHGAVVDECANVTLTDGAHIYDVRLEREHLREELRQSEWEALEYCVAMHEGQAGSPERIVFYPELANRLKGFAPRAMKEVMGYIRDNQAHNNDQHSVSIETLRSALRMMGIRRPRHGVCR